MVFLINGESYISLPPLLHWQSVSDLSRTSLPLKGGRQDISTKRSLQIYEDPKILRFLQKIKLYSQYQNLVIGNPTFRMFFLRLIRSKQPTALLGVLCCTKCWNETGTHSKGLQYIWTRSTRLHYIWAHSTRLHYIWSHSTKLTNIWTNSTRLH